MKSRTSKIVLVIVALSAAGAGLAAWRFGPAALRHLGISTAADPHEEHDEQDEHEEPGHEEPGHEGHDNGEELGEVKLTAERMHELGIELATAARGKLRKRIRLPGQIVVNDDEAAHIVPPAPGVARKVTAKVGDTVRKGDVLAMLESAQLSEAKTQYVAKLNELSCCAVELTRAKALHGTTEKLLALLEKSPSLEALQTAKFTDLSEDHGKLVSAYAELAFAKAVYEREKKLLEQSVSSRADFQTAESAYKKAYAQYAAARSSVAFETRRAMLDAGRGRQNRELDVKAADRKLHILGLTSHDVEHLREALSAAGPAGGGKACSDHNCPNCRAEKESKADPDAHKSGERLGLYSLRAPFDGTVIRRHITLGEVFAGETPVFLIADMSTVWVNLSVYQKDLPHVRGGQAVHITVGAGVPDAKGKISFVSPVVDETTRTCLARVVLPNTNGLLRPGLFVTGEVAVGEFDIPVLVPRNAVQRIEDKSVVFVPTKEGLSPRPVELGRSSRTHVEIAAGLKQGEKYVARGAFDLKAKIITSGLGAHAGHGH